MTDGPPRLPHLSPVVCLLWTGNIKGGVTGGWGKGGEKG